MRKAFFRRVNRVRPGGIMHRLTRPVPPGLWIANFFFQRILRINSSYPWMIHFTSRAVGNIEFGKGVEVSFAVSGGCYFQGNNGISIGEGTVIAPNVAIISANHDPDDYSRWLADPSVTIGKNCWIGAGACILPGVTLGDNVIVGAGAVVTKSFDDGALIAGVPAKVIR